MPDERSFFFRELRSRMVPVRDALDHWIREIEQGVSNDHTYQGLLETLEELQQASAVFEERAVRLYIGEAHNASRSLRSAPALPPTGAFFLLDLLLSEADRAILPGDLEEEFATSILPKYGARRARFWFWTQTVRTIAARNPVCRWLLVGGLMRLGEWIIRRIGG